jgi:hypothetical protein
MLATTDYGNTNYYILVFQKPKITIIFPNNLNLNSKTYNILLPAACNGINKKRFKKSTRLFLSLKSQICWIP